MPFSVSRTVRVFALVGVLLTLLPRVASADAFSIPSPLAANAVTSCSDVTMSGGIVVDSQGAASPNPANKGNLASNGNLTLSGSATVNGDAVIGPGKKVTKSGAAKVTGTTSNATATFDCKPIDLVALKATLQTSNDNAKIPLTAQKKNPLTGANKTDFVMSGTDSLTFPAGTYYFTSFVVSGSATITTTGPVRILTSGTVSMSGGSIAGTNAYGLRFWTSGASVALTSATIKGFVYAPSATASFASATLVGGLFANSVTMSGTAHLTRLIDDVPPRITITSPLNGAAVPNPRQVLVKGTVADDETAVAVRVNGQAATVAANGTWQVTLDLSAAPSPASITATATDGGGNRATASVNVVTAPPVISLTAPAPGTLLATRIATLSGSAGTATAVTVNGTSTVVSGALWSIANFDLGADGAHTLSITGTNAVGGTTITPTLTTDTTPPLVTTSVTPAPNGPGWNQSNPTVSFACTDATSGVQTCPASVTVATETASQTVSATATDKAGNTKSVSVTVKLDRTAPQVAITAPAEGATLTESVLTVTGSVSDTLSAVASVSCNGAPASLSTNTFSCSVTLTPGANTISVVATDAAGNLTTSARNVTYQTEPSDPTIRSLTLTPRAMTLGVGATMMLRLHVTYIDDSEEDVNHSATWTSSAPAVAVVDDGNITAVGAGTATITGTFHGRTASASVNVSAALPASITIDPDFVIANRGETKAFRAIATYANGTTRDVTSEVTWASSDPSVATISSTGTATNIQTGSVTIYASIADVTGFAAFVVEPVLFSVTIVPATATVEQNRGISFSYIAHYDNGEEVEAQFGADWSSSNEGIARVDGPGFLTGLSPGTVTVTVIKDGKTGTAQLRVAPLLDSIAVTPTGVSVTPGETRQFTATATYTDRSTSDVTATSTWTSNTPGVATVDTHGLVTGISKGFAGIIAQVGFRSGAASLEVKNPSATITSVSTEPASATLTPGATVQLAFFGNLSNGTRKDVTASATWSSSALGVATVTTTGFVTVAGSGTATITAIYQTFAASTQIVVVTSAVADPALVAPPLDPLVPTGVFEASQFLYTTSGIQTNLVPNTIKRRQAAVIRGSVKTRDGASISDVQVTVVSAPALGRTRTRTDGGFDLAVNGGSTVKLHFEKTGYIPVDREVYAAWNDYADAADVVLIPFDSAVTTVDPASTTTTVARATVSTDADGMRQATLLFPPQTAASLSFADGTSRPITTFHVRATEYTVGPNGPKAMPADLQPQSGYTYCVELSADEAVAAGATGVTFNKAVPFYVENFLNFAVGQTVPVGYYDRAVGHWVPSDNSRVVSIVAITEGRAYLDVTGDGLADDSDALIGTTPAERDQVATIYLVGRTFWRVPITHFSPWDCNWPYGPDDDAIGPNGGAPKRKGSLKNPTCKCGSRIEVENQILGEDLSVTGTPFSLNYQSDRVAGRKAENKLDIPITGTSVPPSLKRVDLVVAVAGRKFAQSFGTEPNQTYTFEWDGRDVYGRATNGTQPVVVRVGFVYGAVYRTPQQIEKTFGAFGDTVMSNRAREEVTIWQETKTALGFWPAGSGQFAGWTLSVLHSYNPYSRELYEGNGNRRSDIGDGFEVLNSLARANIPMSIGSDAAGNVYFYDGESRTISRISHDDGSVTRIAGGGDVTGRASDGMLATNASIGTADVGGLTVAGDGTVYFAQSSILRRISPDGIITTIAGTGANVAGGTPANGTLAANADLDTVYHAAVAPGGDMYFSYHPGGFGAGSIFRIDGAGRLTRVVGGGAKTPADADGLSARQIQLRFPWGLTFDAEGSLYFIDREWHMVFKVTADGKVHTFAGTSDATFAGDGGPAKQASFRHPEGIAVDKSGNVYVADSGTGRIRRITSDGIVSTVAGGGSGV
jgi:hypothetical protein